MGTETQEPSILDYLKSKLTLSASAAHPWPWRVLLALALALLAQQSMEPSSAERQWGPGVALYLLAAGLVVWAVIRQEWRSPDPAVESPDPIQELETGPLPDSAVSAPLRWFWFIPALLFTALAFTLFRENRFTLPNLLLWLAAVGSMVAALWAPRISFAYRLASLWGWLTRRQWQIRITPWMLLCVVVFAAAIFFRFYRLDSVPPEMVSDHAEKLLDVSDVLSGNTSIFFTRNTGREPFQMYLTALVSLVFGTGASFLSLKLGTVLCGVLTLPYLYALGKELGSRRIGLIALAFAGIAYWPNLISRIGLRFTLYPFFFAPTLYYFLRGMRTSSRNDFILAGLFLGLGLHGYSPFRIVPLLLVFAIGLFYLHRVSKYRRSESIAGLAIIILVSVVVFLPLLRFLLENPAIFSYRMLTRLTGMESPLPGPIWQLFFTNLWRALTMFSWNNGEVWVISVMGRPVLDWVAGGLFNLGVVVLLVRYIQRRHWLDLFLLLSIPILMLPSILSFAFPAENPCLNRTAGAIIPVFLIVGFALDGVMKSLESHLARLGSRLGWLLFAGLFLISAAQNYQLVFNQYRSFYEQASLNTSEMGQVMGAYAEWSGSPETVHLVGYPYWVDSRLVAINAGYPTLDPGIMPENLPQVATDNRAQLFILNPYDTDGVAALNLLYPGGTLRNYDSKFDGKDFLLFYAPAKMP
ncbi:MAG TPA: glycosyltransferase family 39 protein [Anaerolineaceae bacterium]|nr:glycosyltransferase family 39 protein [Longilinea sp.]HNR45520.1 glycosyltransferase family 39 protein [Anaerolineaceae bacterium]HNS36305.1 glycosyltransferase family 39 protein [Anaerolineaceae bacterium]HOD03775.1 glycosyltransferase family 39 protein [Anaerolineaceae bacterium]